MPFSDLSSTFSPITEPLYLTSACAGSTFHVVAIPDSLYLLLRRPKKAQLWKFFFFFCPYTEKYDENNRHCFIFPNLFGSLSLELMRREGKGRVAGPSAISIGRHSTISE